jgi:hypothetical protein
MFGFRNKDPTRYAQAESCARMLTIMKRYKRPTLTKLTPEQAKLKLISLASGGDHGAKDFLKKTFPPDAKKSA